MASLAITVDEERVKRTRTPRAGAGRLLREDVRYGLFVEGIGVESLFA